MDVIHITQSEKINRKKTNFDLRIILAVSR